MRTSHVKKKKKLKKNQLELNKVSRVFMCMVKGEYIQQ